MVNLHYKGNVYHIPETWNELSKKQLLNCIAVLCKQFDEYTTLSLVFRNVSGMGTFCFYTMPKDVLSDCLELVSWIKSEISLTAQLLPCYKGFYGPCKELENLKAKEFAVAELYFMQFRNDNSIDSLNDLVAILYRPGKWKYDKNRNADGDIRIEYNPHTMPYYKKKVGKWPLPVRLSIAIFYEGCRNSFFNNYKEVFDADDEATELPPYGLWSIMRDIAEKGVFGDMDKVEDQYVDTLLMEMHTLIIKARQYERAIKSNI
jgi:hypothetical protein